MRTFDSLNLARSSSLMAEITTECLDSCPPIPAVLLRLSTPHCFAPQQTCLQKVFREMGWVEYGGEVGDTGKQGWDRLSSPLALTVFSLFSTTHD